MLELIWNNKILNFYRHILNKRYFLNRKKNLMQRLKLKKIILTLGIFTPFSLLTAKVYASSFGAEIFCTMRSGGNDHESSWEAAYTYIKKQKGGIFKVSPKQAASQITESVIRDRETFSYCVEYLDKLHPNRKLLKDLQKEKANEDFSEEKFDRYSY